MSLLEHGVASSTTRFVWAGDQILWERKTADGSRADEAGGLVSYFQAGGIDRPLVITKGGTSVVPHQNWRGSFARGTFASGTRAGQSSDCPTYPPSNGCLPISWPGWATTAWHDDAGKQPTTGYGHYWFGSQAVGMRDASGQMYMRNRYYDPATGQFTQPDPIGLAGGLNAYGFGAGDPVSYSDPYGLNPCLAGPLALRVCVAAITVTAFAAGRAGGQMIENAQAGRPLSEGVGDAALSGATEGAALALGAEAAGALATRMGVASIGGASAVRTGASTASDILMPSGSPIGTAGTRASYREVSGGVSEATTMFNNLAVGGTRVASNYPGTLVRLPGGGTVGMRSTMSRSPNSAATIDVNISGLPIDKIKFNP